MDNRNFLVSTDFPLDKVVYQKEVSVTIAAFNFNDVTVPHGLPFLPLVQAQWSTDPNFGVSYNISGGPFSGTNRAYNTGIDADATNIYISTNNNTGSPVTLYFTVYAFMPTTYNVDAAFTDFAGDDFVFNTDYNYGKLLSAGVVSGVITPAFTTQSVLIPHNLGYYPQVSLWERATNGRVSPVVVNRAYSTGVGFDEVNSYVTTQNLVIEFSDTINAYDVHYRIYADEQI